MSAREGGGGEGEVPGGGARGVDGGGGRPIRVVYVCELQFFVLIFLWSQFVWSSLYMHAVVAFR